MRRKYRDRHGRGIRGFLLDPALPAWRTRADKFDDLIAAEFAALNEHLGGRLSDLDVAVLDVPESDPAPWEDGVPLARFLPFDRAMGKRGRLIFYRRPIETAAQRSPQPRLIVHDVVVDQVAAVLGERGEDIDYF
ncbi:metallopeptidase family protein [Arcanobacterium canis]